MSADEPQIMLQVYESELVWTHFNAQDIIDTKRFWDLKLLFRYELALVYAPGYQFIFVWFFHKYEEFSF